MQMCFFVAAISWKPYEVQQPKLTAPLRKEYSKETVNLNGNSLCSLPGKGIALQISGWMCKMGHMCMHYSPKC